MTVDFKPLDYCRAVFSENNLSTTEKAVLTALAMGTDNSSRKVRRSLDRIGRSSGVGRRYVSEILDRPHVRRWLDRVERSPRRVEIWLPAKPPEVVLPQHTRSKAISSGRVLQQHHDGAVTAHSVFPQDTPSALDLPPSALSSRSPFAHVRFERDGLSVADEPETSPEVPAPTPIREPRRRMVRDGDTAPAGHGRRSFTSRGASPIR